MNCRRCKRLDVMITLALLVGCFHLCIGGQNDSEVEALPIFKRDYSVLSFIDVNTYKVIDCSAEHFLDIHWFKDGIPFPFGWNERQLLDFGASLESNNQLLVLIKAEMQTAGNYTCIVSNQHGSIRRELELRVEGNNWIHAPILAYEGDNLCSSQRTTSIGNNVTISCKFFVGPEWDDTVASWYYQKGEAKEGKEGYPKDDIEWIFMRQLNYTQYDDPLPRLEGKLLVTSLHIYNVTEPALGTYGLFVSNGVEPAAQRTFTLSIRTRRLGSPDVRETVEYLVISETGLWMNVLLLEEGPHSRLRHILRRNGGNDIVLRKNHYNQENNEEGF